MAVTLTATLAGHRITGARVTLPAWGAWYADASIDGEVTLSGAVDLVINDATFKGTVLTGGPAFGRSDFRVVGGKGGWGKPLPRKSYANDAGVKVSTILGDAARECGETLDAATVPADRVGPAWTRPDDDPAGRVLQLLAPEAWYVGEDGVTRLGARAASTFSGQAIRVSPVDRARRRLTLAADAIKALVPGVVVDGLSAIDVEHVIGIGEKGATTLRTTLHGKDSVAAHSSLLESFRHILDQLDPYRAFRGVYEYRLVTQQGNRCDLQPVFKSTGMPELQRVSVRPGVAGAKSTLSPGCRVLVGFVNADPARPSVLGFEDPDGSGFLPLTSSLDAQTLVSLGGGADFVALSSHVAAQLSNIATALSTHTHSGVQAGAGVTGPAPPIYTPGPVGATKVKAT